MGQIRLIDNLDVIKRFPTQVKEVMEKLKKGKSKEKGRSERTIDWHLSWAEMIQPMSINEILSGKNFEDPSTEDRIKASSVTLFGKINRWQGYADTPIWVGPNFIHREFVAGTIVGVCPVEVVDLISSFR